MKKFFTIVFLLMSPQAVYAGKIYGPGQRSCGEYISHMGSDATAAAQAVYTSWTMGFLSGFSVLSELNGEFDMKIIDQDAIALWMENYCRTHPIDTYATASVKLANDLTQK